MSQTRVLCLFVGLFSTIALLGCESSDSRLPVQSDLERFPGVMATGSHPTDEDLQILRNVPSEVAPDPERVIRVPTKFGMRGRYWIAPWHGPEQNGDFFCLYAALPEDDEATTQCFDLASYRAGKPAFSTSIVESQFEIVGFTPDPDAIVKIRTGGKNVRLPVEQSTYTATSPTQPIEIEITTNGKKSLTRLSNPVSTR